MIGLDTNVLVRFLTQDDPEQAKQATEVMGDLSATDRGFVPTVVLVETYWVLTRGYKKPKSEVLVTLRDLVSNASIEAQDRVNVLAALDIAAEGADLADALIAQACAAAGCRYVASFDAAAREALNFRAP